MLILLPFKEYPLEYATLGLTVFNPIDLARILIILKLDISAMMGYTGAVLDKFLGGAVGAFAIITTLSLWVGVLYLFMLRKAGRRIFEGPGTFQHSNSPFMISISPPFDLSHFI